MVISDEEAILSGNLSRKVRKVPIYDVKVAERR